MNAPLTIALSIIIFFFVIASPTPAQSRRTAVVVDERLAALRAEPSLSAKLLKRLSRGRQVVIRTERRRAGIVFYRVNVTRRTGGWIQREAVVSARRSGDDQRLFRLIETSTEFDRIVRGRIFLDTFKHSAYRPAVLLMFGDAAEEAGKRLSRDAQRRLDPQEMAAGGPIASYFLNYVGLDRYNRQGIRYVFDQQTRQFHYNGASWREIIRRYPRSPEASVALARLRALLSTGTE